MGRFTYSIFGVIQLQHKHHTGRDISTMARLSFLTGSAGLLLLLLLASSRPADVSAALAYGPDAVDDEVLSLPGLTYKPNFRHFSGYLNVGGGDGGVNATAGEGARMMHYQFFEAETDPETAPVVLWTNGGPGCSGLLGLYTGRWAGALIEGCNWRLGLLCA